jgi:hypothetical protein
MYLDLLSGIGYLGLRVADDGRNLPVFHFRYSNGKDETAERIVAAEVFGNGVLHPGHAGQEPSPYIVGYDIGRRDADNTGITLFNPVNVIRKHFAMNRIRRPDDANWQVQASA